MYSLAVLMISFLMGCPDPAPSSSQPDAKPDVSVTIDVDADHMKVESKKK